MASESGGRKSERERERERERESAQLDVSAELDDSQRDVRV